MPSKKHIVIVGDVDSVPAALKNGSYDLTLICKKDPRAHQDKAVARTYELDIEFSYDINEYLPQMAAICALSKQAEQAAGPIWRVVAPMEQTILPGALLRDYLQIPGIHGDLARRFRDKLLMKKILEKNTAIPLAPYVALSAEMEDAEVLARAAPLGYPLVFKPRMQAGSRGIVVCHHRQDLQGALAQSVKREDFLIEKFIDYPLVHIDGLVRDGELCFVSGSRYLHTCLQWAQEKMAMASASISDPLLQEAIVKFAQQVSSGLEMRDNVFHLEAFLGPKQQLIFLEIGARPGGAGITTSLAEQFGIALELEALHCDLGLAALSAAQGFIADPKPRGSAGWIVTPFPSTNPCVVRKLFGLERLPYSIWFADLPWPGKIYNRYFDEGFPSGKFYLRGKDEAAVRKDLESIAAAYTIEIEEL